MQWDNEIVRPKRPIESVVLAKGVKQELLGDLENFRADKPFYRHHGIPYKVCKTMREGGEEGRRASFLHLCRLKLTFL